MAVKSKIYKNKYTVFSNGEIYDNVLKRAKTQSKSDQGYMYVYVDRKRVAVHRIVAECFIDNPFSKEFVNHKNKIRHDNSVENLEWVTAKENIIHSYSMKTPEEYTVSFIKAKKREKILNSTIKGLKRFYSDQELINSIEKKRKGYLVMGKVFFSTKSHAIRSILKTKK